jgi:hypothetical protein
MTETITERATEIRDAAIESARHFVRRVNYLCESETVKDYGVMLLLDEAVAHAQWVEINLEIGDLRTILDWSPRLIGEWQGRAFDLANRKALKQFDLSTLHAFGTDLLDLERKVRNLDAAIA